MNLLWNFAPGSSMKQSFDAIAVSGDLFIWGNFLISNELLVGEYTLE